MTSPNPNHPVFELRVALTTRDYDRLVKFYCAGLGLEPAAIWNNGQGQALILNMGNATLELFTKRRLRQLINSRRDGALAGPSASHFKYLI